MNLGFSRCVMGMYFDFNLVILSNNGWLENGILIF